MGADYYETAEDIARHSDLPPMGIGEGALIEKAIIDKNCRIGARAQVVNPGNQRDCEVNESCSLRDGILVVEKDACLPAGWHVKNVGWDRHPSAAKSDSVLTTLFDRRTSIFSPWQPINLVFRTAVSY